MIGLQLYFLRRETDAAVLLAMLEALPAVAGKNSYSSTAVLQVIMMLERQPGWVPTATLTRP